VRARQERGEAAQLFGQLSIVHIYTSDEATSRQRGVSKSSPLSSRFTPRSDAFPRHTFRWPATHGSSLAREKVGHLIRRPKQVWPELSAHVVDALLGICLGRGHWPRGQLQHCCRLTLAYSVVGAFLGRYGEVNAVGEIVPVVKRRIVVVVDILGQDVLPFLGHDLQKHLAAEADVAQLLALLIDRLLGRVLCLPGASLDVGPSPFAKAEAQAL
jgi:hypothetical protein